MTIEEKAKTFYELGKEWMKTKVDDSINNEKWIRLEDAQQEIDDCRTSWQNLKDTIPKFDAKISLLETHLEACNRLIDEMQRERGLLKQKLREHLAKYPEDHFVRDAQGDYICDSKGKATGEVFIAKEKDFEKWLKELAELVELLK